MVVGSVWYDDGGGVCVVRKGPAGGGLRDGDVDASRCAGGDGLAGVVHGVRAEGFGCGEVCVHDRVLQWCAVEQVFAIFCAGVDMIG